MNYYAGIDGGQSSTRAVVGDSEGRVIARGSAGPADEVDQGPQSTKLRDALSGALADALHGANLPADTRFERVVAGISGYEGTLFGVPPQVNTAALTLMHDAPIAHAGALAGAPGVVVIAGTGSVAYAVNERGDDALAGGWGYVFGDEGGAFWIARRVLAAAIHDEDSGEPGDLAQLLLAHFSVPSLRALTRAFYAGTITRPQLAQVAPVALHAAESGNERAALIVRDAANALVTVAMRAMERTGMQGAAVAFTGGLLQSPTMQAQVEQQMHSLLPHSASPAPKYPPAEGALLLAYKEAGLALTALHA